MDELRSIVSCAIVVVVVVVVEYQGGDDGSVGERVENVKLVSHASK